MKKKVDLAREYGAQIGESGFKDFYDHPEWRGERFTWTWLTGDVGKQASTQVFLNLCWPGRTKNF